MNLKINNLHIYQKNGAEFIYNFSDSLTFIYGNVGTGKSTLLNLIMYCLGNEFIATPAATNYLEAVQLEVFIQGELCRFFRKMNSKRIIIEDEKEKQNFRIVAHEISDYLLNKCGLPVLYQAENTKTQKRIKLTFKNFSWFFYLKQNEMDSSFFHLDSDHIFKQVAAVNVFLSLLKSNIIIDCSKSEEYRNLRRRCRQYEDGKEIFEYLDRELRGFDNLSLEDELRYIQELEMKIEVMKNKAESFSFEEVEQLLEVQKELDGIKNQYVYDRKKNIYLKALDEMQYKKKRIELERNQTKNIEESNVEEICALFLDCLKEIGFQGVSKFDKVIIDETNHFMPVLYNRFDKQKISFQNLGSGGKKTMYKICFALSIYRYYAERGGESYLPDFLMIDTPMKNISEREDMEMYNKFYQYLFRLFSTELKNKQLIVIDKEEKQLTDYELSDEAIIMKMTLDDVLNPPLFRDYKGL
jgi:hypothetical protein